MSLLVTGSIAIDSITTPYGTRRNVLGGSAAYFARAAALFGPVRLVGVVGEDFPEQMRAVLEHDNIDLRGLEKRSGSRTFRWIGSYHGDMHQAQTLQLELNVLAEEGPKIPPEFADSEFVFLANTHPLLQRELLQQLTGPQLAVADTRDHWINENRQQLQQLLDRIDALVLNDEEAVLLTGQRNLVAAGREIVKTGLRFAVIKKGAHGAMLFSKDELFALPAWPAEKVVDPTGAGDSFAGGMMGYLAAEGRTDRGTIRRALAYGTVVASITIEGFGMEALLAAQFDTVNARLEQLRQLVQF